MEKKEIASKLLSTALYIKETRIPIGEKGIIERLLGGALVLEKLAEEITKEEGQNETDHQQGE